jgi:hypothetical protein
LFFENIFDFKFAVRVPSFKCCHRFWPDAAGTRKLNLFCSAIVFVCFFLFLASRPALLGVSSERRMKKSNNISDQSVVLLDATHKGKGTCASQRAARA